MYPPALYGNRSGMQEGIKKRNGEKQDRGSSIAQELSVFCTTNAHWASGMMLNAVDLTKFFECA